MIKPRLRIAVDMDGVLADVAEQFLRYHERDFGERKSLAEVAGVEELDAFPHSRKHVYEPGFFLTAPVIPESQEVLKALNDRFDVFIVSAATEFPQSLPEKQVWLGQHFPFISWQQMVFCGSKTIIQADWMIDDHFKNLDHFSGDTILFSQPHNLLRENGRHRRVRGWTEVWDIFSS